MHKSKIDSSALSLVVNLLLTVKMSGADMILKIDDKVLTARFIVLLCNVNFTDLLLDLLDDRASIIVD